mgnify:CR=1 FL=1
MNHYKELIVWQKGKKLAVEVNNLTENLPYKSRSLSDQMNRSAVSISSNIAEGHGRGSLKDYIKFLYISKGSVYELSTQMEICSEIYPTLKDKMMPLFEVCEEISRMLNALIKRLKQKLPPKRRRSNT